MILRDYQLKAIDNMKNGCILNGGVGSGKSRTALGYYFLKNGGKLEPEFEPIDDTIAKDLYIITTAHKRDLHEWDSELALYLLSPYSECRVGDINIVIDSWNNIKKYKDVTNAFFIFDEQRLVGSGTWVKTFYKIAKNNEWILLSATPGDTWSDYIPVFVANGFYKNKSEFIHEHVIYSRYTKYPKIDRYLNTRRLVRLRDSILVNMEFERTTVQHHEDILVDYPIFTYKWVVKERKDIETKEPLRNASELCYLMRKVVNSDPSRIEQVLKIIKERKKAIIFYNFDYELEILKNIPYGKDVKVAEWNGHKHQEIPNGDKWVYLVQYTAGCEGWNSTTTDTIIFYSQNYSYKVLVQACGRIDRLNTPYTDLYYYHLKSHSSIDAAISRALKNKKKFNEGKFVSRDYDFAAA